jgi:hypothetical protein
VSKSYIALEADAAVDDAVAPLAACSVELGFHLGRERLKQIAMFYFSRAGPA